MGFVGWTYGRKVLTCQVASRVRAATKAQARRHTLELHLKANSCLLLVVLLVKAVDLA